GQSVRSRNRGFSKFSADLSGELARRQRPVLAGRGVLCEQVVSGRLGCISTRGGQVSPVAQVARRAAQGRLLRLRAETVASRERCARAGRVELPGYSCRTFGAATARQNEGGEALRWRSSMSEETPKRARLRINEIFHSLQGEADAVGFRTVFVRLTGCPLRCQYCDTEYAFHAGEWHDIDAILDRVQEYATPHVCVTGGEPLAQPNCRLLLMRLCDAGHQVSLETSGALDISAVDARVARVVDVKTPGSGEAARNRIENFALLTR